MRRRRRGGWRLQRDREMHILSILRPSNVRRIIPSWAPDSPAVATCRPATEPQTSPQGFTTGIKTYSCAYCLKTKRSCSHIDKQTNERTLTRVKAQEHSNNTEFWGLVGRGRKYYAQTKIADSLTKKRNRDKQTKRGIDATTSSTLKTLSAWSACNGTD